MAKVAHLKGPEKEGNREPVYFATHADYVEGLDDRLDAVREIAEQAAFVGDGVAIIAKDTAPADKNSYWFYVDEKKEGD